MDFFARLSSLIDIEILRFAERREIEIVPPVPVFGTQKLNTRIVLPREMLADPYGSVCDLGDCHVALQLRDKIVQRGEVGDLVDYELIGVVLHGVQRGDVLLVERIEVFWGCG